ncbi:hypothetical protein BGW80DRAFT_1247714 [Lactifluus volemus]|nr:hypothetical protein BGW80DRAFT_1247714 [Lactifluus volemus]
MPRTNAFFTQLETFKPTRARIDFTESSAHVIISALQPTDSPDIILSVSCARLDFQVSAMAQICSALGSALLPIEDLTLWFYHHPGKMPEERLEYDEVDPALWRAILCPSDTEEDGHALKAALNALSAFVSERCRARHPVYVEPQDLSRLWSRSRPESALIYA